MAPPAYLFARDVRASIRLNYQHLAIRQLYGFLLHPSVPTNGPLQIADIGAGTGVLPIELGQQLPSATIAGFDISDAQFPPTAWLPPNVSLHVHDAFTPFPEHHIASYDIVHMRFFVTLLNSADDLRRLMENLISLLKPGGHLYWLDADPRTATCFHLTPSTPTPAVEKLVALMRRPFPVACYDWISAVPAVLTSKNLRVLVQGYHEFSIAMAEKKAQHEESEDVMSEATEAIAELEAEFKGGASMDVDYFYLVAKRAGK